MYNNKWCLNEQTVRCAVYSSLIVWTQVINVVYRISRRRRDKRCHIRCRRTLVMFEFMWFERTSMYDLISVHQQFFSFFLVGLCVIFVLYSRQKFTFLATETLSLAHRGIEHFIQEAEKTNKLIDTIPLSSIIIILDSLRVLSIVCENERRQPKICSSKSM